MVVGLLTAANAAGQLIFLPTNAALIAYAGWRAMVLILAGIVLLVVLPLLLMRDHPQDLGLFAYGDTTGQGLAPRHSGNPVAVAFRALWDGARVRDFWRSRSPGPSDAKIRCPRPQSFWPGAPRRTANLPQHETDFSTSPASA
jgi:hypothetical protein